MNLSQTPPAFSFHIDGGESQDHVVPAAILVQILENAQRAFELIGVHIEGRGIKERARVSTATSRRFQLICQLPQKGSYAIPLIVGNTGELFPDELAVKACGIFRSLMGHVSLRNTAALANDLPDERIRRRVLEAVKGMAPRADAKWKVSLHDAKDNPFAIFDSTTIPFVQEVLVPAEQREAARVVTGELKRIDFTERKITLIYPPTSKELECIYEEAVEDLLYEKRRDLIQVTGRVLLDDQGEPKQIIDVTDIRDLDISPLTLDVVRGGSSVLTFSSSLILDVTSDESKQLLCVENKELGISAFASTREGLIMELHDQITMLWIEYALAADNELDVLALQLKKALLAQVTEVDDAS
jgi:hypothetical protein